MSLETFILNKNQVARLFRDAEPKRRLRKKKFRAFLTDENPIPHEDTGLPLMVRAKKILGIRMQEKVDGYYLDNRPASCYKIAEAAGLSIGKS
jgi:hypothetical protein